MIFAWDAKSRREFLQIETEDPHVKVLNDQVRALAKQHRFKIMVREDGRLAIPCRGDAGLNGYWQPASPETWAFTHPFRRFPDKDIAALQKIEPRLARYSWFEEEVWVHGPTEAALRVMLLDEPEFSSSRRMRPPRLITPEQKAAMAAGRARKAAQALPNPEIPFHSGTGASPPTSGTSSPPTPPSKGETALEGVVAPSPAKSPDKERRPS